MNNLKKEDTYAQFEVAIPLDLLEEIKDFFPVKTKVKEKYANLVLKVKELNKNEIEIKFEGKNPIVKTLDLRKEYSNEEVIFYTYVLLQTKYEWFNTPKGSILKEYPLNLFIKSKDYTRKDREDFFDKRIFEMFLYCCIESKADYHSLPVYEELWRIFRTEKHLLWSTYELIFRHENNQIRRFFLAEKAFLETGNYSYLHYILDECFTKKEYKRYIDIYIKNLKVVHKDNSFPYDAITYANFIESCVKAGEFDTAKENLRDDEIRYFHGSYNKSFFEGVIAFYKKDFLNAEKSFEKALVYDEESESECTKSSTIFYTLSLLEQNKKDIASSLVFSLKPIKLKDEGYERLSNFDIADKEIDLISQLEKISLTNNQKTSLIYYKTSLIAGKINLTKEDASSIIKNLKLPDLVRIYSQEFEYNFYLSDAYYTLGSYDKAYEHKIRSYYTQDEEQYVAHIVEISKTSKEFQNNLIKHLTEISEKNHPSKVKNYVEKELPEVIDYFWTIKNYKIVAEIYHFLNDKKLTLPEEYLFEFAYSLVEESDTKEAKNCYELYIKKSGKTSSVLNNLALIYEGEGDLKKAKDIIMEAYNLAKGKDATVNRNKERLFAVTKKKTSVPGEKSKMNQLDTVKEDKSIEYHSVRDLVIYNGKKLQLRNGDNITKIIREIFSNPKSAHLEQDLLDVIGSDGTRTIYDAVKNINKKLRGLGLRSDLLLYSGSKVTVLLEYVNDLKIVEPS